jgi:integrase
MARAIIKDGCRILTPLDNEKLNEWLNADYRIITKSLLHTYMRLPELQFLLRHPECYHGVERCIDLPTQAATKVKAVYKERTIPLTIEGCKSVEDLFKHIKKIPFRQSMITTLRLAARKAKLPEEDKGIMPKMYRKSFLSWLCECYPEKLLKISKSAGHTIPVMEEHYIGIFTVKQDIDEMKAILKGWGEA